jgi:hypothetical protein
MRRLIVVLAVLCGGSNCGGGSKVKQPYATPPVETFLAHLRTQGAAATSYVATENTMDYWVGKERIKTTTHVMGKRGAMIRFNAINPATGSTAADLACDGTNFVFVDYQHNCYLQGVCDANAIASLMRVRLEPDDFLLLAVGSTPIIDGATGTAKWDGDGGTWQIDLAAGGARQTIVLDGNDKDGKWEVVKSTVTRDGVVDWKLENKGFETVDAFRLPRSSRFEQPGQKADLVADWGDRQVNLELDPAKFGGVQVAPNQTVCPSKP